MSTATIPSQPAPFALGLAALLATALMVCSIARAATGEPLAQDCATIVLKASRPRLVAQRYVIDRGTAVMPDTAVVEKMPFPELVGDFCIGGNVTYFCSWRASAEPARAAITPSPALIIGRAARADFAPNVNLVGRFDSRGVLEWKRPPGRMRLQIINTNGNESVCAPVDVEAGKVYEITIHHTNGTKFEVKVR